MRKKWGGILALVGGLLTIGSAGYLGFVQRGVIDSSHPEQTVWPAIGTLLLGGVVLLIASRLGWYGPDPADPSVFPKLFHFKVPTPVERSPEEMQEMIRQREERIAYLRRPLELGYAGPGIRRRLLVLAIISLFLIIVLIILTGGKVDFSNQAVLNIVLIIVLLLTLLIFLVYGLLQLIVFSIRLVHVIREERQGRRNRLPSSHERDDRP